MYKHKQSSSTLTFFTESRVRRNDIFGCLVTFSRDNISFCNYSHKRILVYSTNMYIIYLIFFLFIVRSPLWGKQPWEITCERNIQVLPFFYQDFPFCNKYLTYITTIVHVFLHLFCVVLINKHDWGNFKFTFKHGYVINNLAL